MPDPADEGQMCIRDRPPPVSFMEAVMEAGVSVIFAPKVSALPENEALKRCV